MWEREAEEGRDRESQIITTRYAITGIEEGHRTRNRNNPSKLRRLQGNRNFHPTTVFSNCLNESGNRFSPWASRREHSPAYFDFTIVKLKGENQLSDYVPGNLIHRNHKLINRHHFKVLTLYEFVTEAKKRNTPSHGDPWLRWTKVVSHNRTTLRKRKCDVDPIICHFATFCNMTDFRGVDFPECDIDLCLNMPYSSTAMTPTSCEHFPLLGLGITPCSPRSHWQMWMGAYSVHK